MTTAFLLAALRCVLQYTRSYRDGKQHRHKSILTDLHGHSPVKGGLGFLRGKGAAELVRHQRLIPREELGGKSLREMS